MQDSRERLQKDSKEGGGGRKGISAASAQTSKHEWSSVHPYTSTFQEAFKKPNKNSKKKAESKRAASTGREASRRV